MLKNHQMHMIYIYTSCISTSKLKKVLVAKLNIQIKVRLHHRVSCDKSSKIRPHMHMFRLNSLNENISHKNEHIFIEQR